MSQYLWTFKHSCSFITTLVSQAVLDKMQQNKKLPYFNSITYFTQCIIHYSISIIQKKPKIQL